MNRLCLAATVIVFLFGGREAHSQQELLSIDPIDGQVKQAVLPEKSQGKNEPSDTDNSPIKSWVDITKAMGTNEGNLLCGRNALFLFVNSHGARVTMQEVEALLPVTDKGSNMADMKDVSEKLGVSCEVRFVSPRELNSAKLPFIVRVGDSEDVGHFSLVYQHVDGDKGFKVIDGTDGNSKVMPNDTFSETYSGHVLLAKSADYTSRWQWVLRVSLATLCGVIAILGVRFMNN